MKKLLYAFLFVCALNAALFTTGCAVLSGADSASAAAVQSGIEVGVALYVQHKGNNDPTQEAAVAAQLVSIAQTLEGLNMGTLTIAQFNAQAAVYIKKLSPADQIIATGLLAQLDLYFAQVIQNKGSLLGVNTAAAANVVLNDVIAACALFLPPPAAGHR